MHCTKTTSHRPLSGKLGQFMIIDMTSTKDKKAKIEKPKADKQPARGTFGWDNIDVVL